MYIFCVLADGEYLFVDPDYKLSKYAPKNWRSSSTHVSVPRSIRLNEYIIDLFNTIDACMYVLILNEN